MHVMKLLSALSIFILSIFSVNFSSAQEVHLPGSRSQALAGITVSLADSYSIFGNQAGMAKTNRLTIGGTFQNRYLLKELSTRSALLIVPIQSSVFALSLYQFGQTNFHQEKLGFAYARNIIPQLQFGIQFNYYRFFMAEENRSIGSTGLELGFQYQLTPRLLIGIHALNPYRVKIQTISGEYFYPSRLTFGTHLLLSESFAFLTELQKDNLFPLIIKSGLEYDVLNKFFIRTGIEGKPYQLSAGMGIDLKYLKIDLAVTYNQNLGNSPSVSFQYQF